MVLDANPDKKSGLTRTDYSQQHIIELCKYLKHKKPRILNQKSGALLLIELVNQLINQNVYLSAPKTS